MLSIEPLAHEDLPHTAALHKENLKLGLFPRLGRHFLSLYQEGFALSPHGIALVARREDGEIVGALFGTTSNAEHFRWVTRHQGLQLALAGSGAMLVRPRLAYEFTRTRLGRYTRGVARHMGLAAAPPLQGSGQGSSKEGPVSVLSHIVTTDAVRRQGVGRGLVEKFKTLARQKGVHRAVLVTEEGGMGSPFFEKLGCRLVKRRKGQDGTLVREYKMIIDEDALYEQETSWDRGGFRSYGLPVPAHARTFDPRGPFPAAPDRY